jgi:hypothetical protein
MPDKPNTPHTAGQRPARFGDRRFLVAAAQYTLGRGANALVSIALFVLIARQLGASGYGPYVALMAMVELLLVAGNLGTEWVTAVEVPRLSQREAGAALRRLVAGCLAVQALAFALLAGAMVLASAPLAAWFDLGDSGAALHSYALLLLVEGLGRSVRDQMLSSLLLQWMAQFAQLLRNLLVFVALLWLAYPAGALPLAELARIELLASAAGLLVGGAYLALQLLRMPAGSAEAQDLHALRRRALHAWAATLSHQVWSGHAVVLLVTRSLGSEAGGLVGFARNMAEQVRRFMPVEFAFTLIRTFLVTRLGSEGRAALPARVALLWRLNALLLLPLPGIALVYGSALGAWVSAGQIAGAGALLAWWLLWVLAWSHHRLSDTLAVLLDASASMGRYSLALLPALGLFLAMLELGGLHVAFAVLVAVELGYCLLVARAALRAAGLRYPWAQLRLLRLIVAAATALLLSLLPAIAGLALDWRLGALLALAGYGLALLALRPVRLAELRGLRGQAQPAMAGPGEPLAG